MTYVPNLDIHVSNMTNPFSMLGLGPKWWRARPLRWAQPRALAASVWAWTPSVQAANKKSLKSNELNSISFTEKGTLFY